MMKTVCLYSGGLDSFCLATLTKPDVLVYFDIGLPEQREEIASLESFRRVCALPAPLIIDKRFQGLAPYKLSNEVMPFRNLYFLAGAFSYGSTIYLGKTASSRNLDKNEKFAELALQVLKHVSAKPENNTPGLVSSAMRIEMPLGRRTKSSFVREVLHSTPGAARWLVHTRSCYSAQVGWHCGQCVSCIRRAVAFVNNGLFHGSDWLVDPRHAFVEYREQVKKWFADSASDEEQNSCAYDVLGELNEAIAKGGT